jgi:signal transduction histidine kinase
MSELVESDVLPDAASAADLRHQILELTRVLAARDRFIVQVGHELRNSVAPMLLLADQFATMANEPDSHSMVVSRAAALTRALKRLVATIDRVAEVSDLRRGKLRLEPTRVDLVEVVAEVCREVQREAAASGSELAIIAPGPVIGQWDRTRVKQIVANLVSNAIRYGGGGRVELGVHCHGSDAELVVRDHGPGIDPVMLPHVFDGFDRNDAGRRGGFGVGLWLVKTLCGAMHGSVTAENGRSEGARFCVVLPCG